MKGAILNSDRVVTVSESYAWEITREEHGVGLQSILQEHSHRLNGIVNGMDRHTWNPETDTYLPATFSAENLAGKAKCKAALRRQLGLPEPQYGVDVPLVGFVGRLDPQKGPDLIIDALSAILSLDCQVRCSLPTCLRSRCKAPSHPSTVTSSHLHSTPSQRHRQWNRTPHVEP
jgi:starch synthase